jgi:hypothetical protein
MVAHLGGILRGSLTGVSTLTPLSNIRRFKRAKTLTKTQNRHISRLSRDRRLGHTNPRDFAFFAFFLTIFTILKMPFGAPRPVKRVFSPLMVLRNNQAKSTALREFFAVGRRL